ncbi:uncharacterized protein LOC134454932 [Engraulis encrasicolus]|uniref:uncharacterized protein LOC134454932 n=1 Tax=Engraulis encrasicolus TaxID=184585 RepID=UPI002FD4ACD1
MVKLLWSTLEMLLLMMTLLLLTPLHGERAIRHVDVFSRAGEAAVLPCVDVMSGDPLCSSTTWEYYKASGSWVKVVSKGKVQQSGRSERLRLLPNCSLHISHVSPEDAGYYRCQPYKESDFTDVLLSVLHTLPGEDPSGGLEVVSCLASTYGGWCGHVRWVDESGAEQLNSDHVKINRKSNCEVQLAVKTTVLMSPAHTHTWTCQLTYRGEVKASIPYTVHTPEALKGAPPTWPRSGIGNPLIFPRGDGVCLHHFMLPETV